MASVVSSTIFTTIVTSVGSQPPYHYRIKLAYLSEYLTRVAE